MKQMKICPYLTVVKLKSYSLITAQFVSDSSSVGHLATFIACTTSTPQPNQQIDVISTYITIISSQTMQADICTGRKNNKNGQQLLAINVLWMPYDPVTSYILYLCFQLTSKSITIIAEKVSQMQRGVSFKVLLIPTSYYI